MSEVDVDAAVERLEDYVAHGAPFDHIGSIVVVLDALVEARSRREDDHWLITRQGDLLTAAVNALRGDPPELVMWSHHDVAELAAAMKARAEAAEAERDELAKFKEKALRTFDTLERQRNEAEADLRKCGLRGEGLATDRRDAIERADAAEAKLARIAEGVAELQQSDDRAWVSNIGDGLALILNEGTETNG